MSATMNDLHAVGLNPFAVQLLAESMLKSAYVKHCGTQPLTFNYPVQREDCAGWIGVRITIEAVSVDGQPQAEAVPAQQKRKHSVSDLTGFTDAVQAPLLKDIAALCETIRYMVGIAERGSGGKCPDGMAPEVFLLRYVRRLEAALEFVARHKSSDWPERCQQMVDAGRSVLAAPQQAEPLQQLRAMIADDAFACTFQTMGQYRTALLRAADEAREHKGTAT